MPELTTTAGRALLILWIADDEVPGQLDFARFEKSIAAIEAEARAEGYAEAETTLSIERIVERRNGSGYGNESW